MDLFGQIYRRRSQHRFRETEKLSDDELRSVSETISAAVPLDSSIRTETAIVPASETSCKLGAEYCILFYSEKKGDWLRNVGYIGEQIDLSLTAQSIGTLWYGFGKTKEKKRNGLDFVIMIAISKVPANSFRVSPSQAKRKPVEKTWNGGLLSIAETVSLAPSAVNTQPWYAEFEKGTVRIFRNAKNLLMPSTVTDYFNRIDIGIYLCILEVCFSHVGIAYKRQLFSDIKKSKEVMILAASYELSAGEGQIRRITGYEDDMRSVSYSLDSGAAADLETGEMIRRLETYYGSFEWKVDFQSDEAGLLPPDLKRGVLSEDGINELLDRYRCLTGVAD